MSRRPRRRAPHLRSQVPTRSPEAVPVGALTVCVPAPRRRSSESSARHDARPAERHEGWYFSRVSRDRLPPGRGPMTEGCHLSDMKDRATTAVGAADHVGGDPGQTTSGPVSEQPSTMWAGWAFFAGVLMVIVGALQLIKALTALFNQHYLLVSSSGLALHVDLAAWGWGWGWVHLVIGLVVIAAGFGVITGQMWGRVLGIVLTAVSAIVNLLDIAAYPLWSIMIIALDVVIIYALAVRGSELKSA